MKILCLSDTHSMHHKIQLPDLSGIDVVVHTGDFSSTGDEISIDHFLCWFADLPVKHKLLVAGNHDKFVMHYNDRFKIKCAVLGITYLQDSGCEINEIKFWGTPWVNQFYNWAFMMYEKDLAQVYKLIPKDTQILLSHGPANGILDYVERPGGGNVGAAALKERLAKLKHLKYHIFGHIHENHGVLDTGSYIAVNASSVTEEYKPINLPIIIKVVV